MDDFQPRTESPFPDAVPQVEVVLPPRRPYWLHTLLFLLTGSTTMVVGARLQENFMTGQPMFVADDHFFPLRWIWEQPSRIWMGLPFSVSLLGILMAHEMGHFVLSVRHRVYATLPFFIPAPTPIGTFGAFIQIKSLFRSRKALFDIGIAGPIAGFVVALPLAMLGLLLSHRLPSELDPTAVAIGQPLVFYVLNWVAKLVLSPESAAALPLSLIQLHPIAVAAWTGMLATSLNLLPGGQLDGGHIVYALRPSAHRMVTRAAMVALVPMAVFFWSGWLIWVFGLMLTMRHPPVPSYTDLPRSRRLLGWSALLMFVLTFVPAPFPGGSIYEVIREAMS